MAKIKEGFKGERLVSLPENLLNDYGRDPLIGDLYVRKIGFFPRVKYHYVNQPSGCGYAMLVYCTEGRGWYAVGGRRYEVDKNSYLLVPPHTPYALGADDANPWTIYWLHFQGRSAASFMPDRPEPRPLLPDEHSRLQDRFRLFEEIYVSFARGYIREYMAYASMCLHLFLGSFVFLEQYRRSAAPARREQAFSARVIRYMQENVRQQLTLAQLAAFFKYSPSHFSMRFAKETGVPPIDYFIRLKIRAACREIELTALPLNEISARLGFGDPAYFSRVFTKVMGIPPSEYRKRKR